MSSNPSAAASQSKQPTPPAPQGSSARLIVLLGLLAVAIGALAYDFAVAKPTNDAADEKIHKYVDESNRQSVKDGQRVTSAEIQKLLGTKPTWIEKHPDDRYDVEYYCQWGQVPVLNLRRHYLTVVYVGDEPRHYTSHYKNELPPIEALPIQQTTPEVADGQTPPPTSSADPTKVEPKEGEPAAAEGKPADAPAAEPKEGEKAEGEKK
jgi:hypothetical protein